MTNPSVYATHLRMRRTLMTLCIFSLSLAAYGETAEDARKELSTTLTAIKESDAKQKELAQKTLKLQAELKSLQEETVSMGKDTGQEEEELSSNEEKLGILEQQKNEKTQALAARQTELSSMISAMVKLRQLPPEAVIAMPGKLDETLETARALGVVTHAIEEEAQSLKLQLHELDALEDKIRHSRETIAVRQTLLTQRQTELAAKIKERNALVEKLGGQERAERQRIAELDAKSKSLQELIDSLQKSEYGWMGNKAKNEKSSPREKASAHKLRSFAKAQGHVRMPAAGKIVSHFGNTDQGETFSKGILIETRKKADVVAPYDGEVVFAGPFRDYGSMVIIRHSGEYHTLLSGMEEIDCKPGQYLLEGEPIGSMGKSPGSRLYMELREDGKPVDPIKWVKG